jgi:hypothetical protein
MTHPTRRHPRREANSILAPGHEARVLEPSPPASCDPAWYADDPTDPTGAAGIVVTPIPGEGITWADASTHSPDVAAFARSHWLDGRRRLEPLPAGYDAGRRALHQVAFFVVAPPRYAATGKLGLRYIKGGFGTPFFARSGADEQVRIEADLIVHQEGDSVRAEPLTSLAAAAAFLGLEYRDVWFDNFHDPLAPAGADTPLSVDSAVTDAVGDWFGFGTHVLERARRTEGAEDVSRVQLWPEDFDPAFEMGSYERGARASYGASPGDDDHPEPYLYVAAWGEIDRADPYWNDSAFNGASLGYAELAAAPDPYARAIAFIEDGHRRLTT